MISIYNLADERQLAVLRTLMDPPLGATNPTYQWGAAVDPNFQVFQLGYGEGPREAVESAYFYLAEILDQAFLRRAYVTPLYSPITVKEKYLPGHGGPAEADPAGDQQTVDMDTGQSLALALAALAGAWLLSER